MATGRIGVTPVLRVRWSKLPTTGTTVLSGLDDNSVALVYDAGYEAVYRNGVLLSRGNDYTATNGTTVTLIDATLAGDIIEILANDLVPLTDAISKGQYTAKGALLSASAASTPGVVTVGANDTVLTADSSTATGLKWATPAAGGMTLISTTTLSGASVTLSSIPSTYNDLVLIFQNPIPSVDGDPIYMRINSDTGTRYRSTQYLDVNQSNVSFNASRLTVTPNADSSVGQGLIQFEIPNYANTTTWKTAHSFGVTNNGTTNTNGNLFGFVHMFNQIGAISSLTIFADTGNLTSGSVLLYGVK